MLLANHQFLPSGHVLSRWALAMGVTVVVFGLLSFVLLRGARQSGSPSVQTITRALLALIGTLLVACAFVALLPISIDDGAVHCGTALFQERSHTCADADFADRRTLLALVFGAAVVAFMAVIGSLTTLRKAALMQRR